jgi:hypothetical protein
MAEGGLSICLKPILTIPVPVTGILGRIADLQSYYGDRIHICPKLEIGAQNAAFQQKYYM